MSLDWSKLDGPTLAIIFATFFGPIAAVQAQKWIEAFREKRNQKLAVFASLMYTRGTRLSNDHVQALNRIEIAFFKVKDVMDAWKAYLDALNMPVTTENNAVITSKRDDKFCALVFAMSSHLKYPFNETDIKNSSYRPIIHHDIENAQMKVLTWMSEVADGKQKIPISVIVPDEVFNAQVVLNKWLQDVAEGKATIPVSIRSDD